MTTDSIEEGVREFARIIERGFYRERYRQGYYSRLLPHGAYSWEYLGFRD